MAKQHAELLAALAALRIDGKYSDLTIRCNSRKWHVHKAILHARSRFFDSAVSNGFRETQSGVVDLSDEDEEAVDHMITYFYHLDYLPDPEDPFENDSISDVPVKELSPSLFQDPLVAQALAAQANAQSPQITSPARATSAHAGSLKMRSKGSETLNRKARPRSESGSDSDDADASSDDAHLLTHARVYALAEKFGIQGLKAISAHKFETSMACFYDSPELPDAIDEVYHSTIDSDRGLRNIVLQTFRTHPQLANTQDVYEVIKTTPALALELWKVERGLPV